MKITLCGSARFMAEIDFANHSLSKQGHLVYSLVPNVNPDGRRDWLDVLHRAKILASDAIYVVAPDGEVGEHTRAEINFAIANGKQVMGDAQ